MNTKIHPTEPGGVGQCAGGSFRSPFIFSKRSQPGGFLAGLLLLASLFLQLFHAPSAHGHSSPPGCTGSGLGILLFTDSPDVHIGDTLNYSVTIFNGVGLGPVVCDATSIQAAVVTPDGISHPITLVRTNLSNGQSDFYSNVVSYVVRAQDVRPDATVRATASDTSVIHQNDTDSQGGGNQGVNTEVSLPCIQIAVQCVGSVGENGPINFTGTVTNCGNNTLVGVTVTNFVNGQFQSVAFITNLARGQIAAFSGSWIPTNPCALSTAIFTARGTDTFTTRPQTVTNAATTACSAAVTAGIVVTKECPINPPSPGQLLTFSGSVSNSGNVTLTNVLVVNSQPVANTVVFTLPSLAPGVTANFTGSYLTPTNCSVADTLTASASSRCGVPVTHAASATCPILTTPSFVVTALCPVTPVLPGGSVTYNGSLQNTGDIALTNVSVRSDRPAANTVVLTVGILAPGATTNFTATYTVPVGACAIATTFSGIGRGLCSASAITNTTVTTCNVTTAPGIAVTLTCPVVNALPGGQVIYTGTVRNSGNVTLNNVFVVNNQPTNNAYVLGPISLAPGVVSNFTTSFTAPLDSCLVSSTVMATGSDSCSFVSVTNTASTTCPLQIATGLILSQSCPLVPAVPGGLLTYSGTVSNAGNITITNVVILNNLSGASPIFTTGSIAPGVVMAYGGSFLAPTNCSVTSVSIVTGRSLCGLGTTNTVNSTCPILTTPQVVVTALCPVTPVIPGGTVTYTGTIRNAGNITLTNVAVLSDRPAANTTVFTVGILVPGAITNFTATYAVPVNACFIATTFSGIGRDVCTLASVTNTVTPICNVTTAPGIAVTLTCPVTPATTGGLIVYTGTVRNSGNVTLNNVFVVNSQPFPNTPILGPISLAPGVVSNFTASFTAPFDSCLVNSTVMATGSDNCSSASVTNTASTTCPLVTTPSLILSQSCPLVPAVPGGLLTYSGTVSNAGNITITNVVILNNLSGASPIFTTGSIAPGVVMAYGGSFLAPTNCSVASVSIVTGRSTCGIGTTNTVNSTCPIVTAPQVVVTALCPVAPVIPGGTVTYTGTVRNAGNITLTNVVVLSDRPAPNTTAFTVGVLAPGVTTNFTATYAVPVNACFVATTFSSIARDACTLASVTNTVTPICNVTTAPAIAVSLTCPVTPATTGGLIVYTGSVQNLGNVTLNNVFVVNNQPSPNTAVIGPITLAPGASSSFTTSFTTPFNACSVSSTVLATGTDNCSSVSVTNTATTTCPLATTPSLILSQSCPLVPAVPGGLLVYSGTVSNAGNITITNVVILNNLSGASPIFTTNALVPGAVASYAGSYLAPTNCSVTSVSIVTGRSICGIGTTNTVNSTCPIQTAPQVVVTALCPVTPIIPGGSVTYTGTVRNAGNITLTNVVVLSDRPAANTTVFTVATLAPGVTTNFTATYSVPVNACFVATTFSGVGRDICTLTSVTNTVSANCTVTTAPAIAVSLTCPVVPATTGGQIVYTGTVRNAGNVILNNVFVVNSQPTNNAYILGPISLAPGAVSNFTASFTAPFNACSVSSTVIATGSDNCTAAGVTNTATTTCPLATTPSLLITQSCPLNPAVPGGLLTYSGTVSNTGNITITNVVVLNNLSGASPVFTAATLAPGSVVAFTGSFLAPTNCSVTSISTVTGRSICGIGTTNATTTTCPILTAPAIVVTQVCPITPVLQGGTLTYSGTVRNAGNITLTNVVVTNDRPASNTVIFTIATLAPGATANFTGSYQVPTNCCVVSSTVRASGQACLGVTVTDTATRTCTVFTMPSLVVTKVCTPGVLRPGDLLTYTGSVSNSGNITLINVTVANDQPFSINPLFGPAILAPGEAFDYTASYIVPPDFCGTDTVTATGLNVCTFQPVTHSVTVTCPVITPPGRITVTKNCPESPTPRGGLYTFSGTVGNPGPVTLVNVYVVDNQPTNNTPVIGPITLAPGQVVSFSGSYVAPRCCCLIIDTLTARGQARCTGSNLVATATAVCPLLSNPSIALVPNCPALPILMGSTYQYSGYVTNTGDVVLTNIFVFGPQGTNAPVLGPIELAPGEAKPYSGSYNVPFDACAVTVTTSGRDTCGGLEVGNAASCPIQTTPQLAISETCPPGPVTNGSVVAFGGSITNTGNITLTNVMVFSSQSSNSSPVLGPITLAPGASAPFSGGYTALSGANPTTNTTVLTNSSVVITTNTTVTITTNPPTPTRFGTINAVTQTAIDRFIIGTNHTGLAFKGFTYAGEDHGYGATQFYSLREATNGVSFFDTVTASTAVTADRFTTGVRTFDALTYAASDVGYGPLLFYYLSHDLAGVSSFGSITPGGVVGVVADHFVVGTNFDALAFTATDIGYGENMFYYVRHDATGLSTFGTINPALPGTVTDRFTVGTNVDSLVFTDLTAPGYGANNFYYLRHDTNGVSTFGTIFVTSPTTAMVTDRFVAGTNLTDLTFTATDAGSFGANLFYYLRGLELTFATNVVKTFSTNQVVTFTTNSVISFTPANTVTVFGMDICQARTVSAAASCLGPVTPQTPVGITGSRMTEGGNYSLTFPTETGKVYTVEYKNSLNDPAWLYLQTVVGNGADATVTDPTAFLQPMRFYRIVSTP